MRRSLLNLLTALLLLPSVVVVALWVRSYSGTDYLSRHQPLSADPMAVTSRIRQVACARGGIRFSTADHPYYPAGHHVEPIPPDAPVVWGRGRIGLREVWWDELPRRSIWNRMGFHRYEWGHGASFYDEHERGVVVPAWLPAALLAVPPLAAAARSLARRRRRRAGLCPA